MSQNLGPRPSSYLMIKNDELSNHFSLSFKLYFFKNTTKIDTKILKLRYFVISKYFYIKTNLLLYC